MSISSRTSQPPANERELSTGQWAREAYRARRSAQHRRSAIPALRPWWQPPLGVLLLGVGLAVFVAQLATDTPDQVVGLVGMAAIIAGAVLAFDWLDVARGPTPPRERVEVYPDEDLGIDPRAYSDLMRDWRR